MRTHTLSIGFLLSAASLWGMPAYADVLDSQLDDSVQATRPTEDYRYIYSDGFYVAVGYVPPSDFSFAGLRFRVNASGGGNYLCPAGDIYEYYGTSTPDVWNSGHPAGSIIHDKTTPPDAEGNCDYTTIDRYGRALPIALSAQHYYVFLMAVGGDITNWVSMSGKSLVASTTQDSFGFRPATHNEYWWGMNGLESPYFQFFDTVPPAPDLCATPGACASNVLFLPGIEGSRLYEGIGCSKAAEEKLWDPIDSYIGILLRKGDKKVQDLSLDSMGNSLCSDIYTKEGDIIDSVGGSSIYASLVSEMDGLKSDGTIKDWKPVAYDWRLSLTDLLSKGSVHDGKIYYGEATSTPYIEQTLRALATSSKTGKVTIIAHSNGGLVAKALLNKLGGPTAKSLVDKIVMVGVPQSGAPEDIGATLFGYEAGIYQFGIPIVSDAAVRAFALNSPMAYHLLPSEDYLESTMGDSEHPVIRFSGDAYAKEQSAYGSTIANRVALDDYLLAKEGGRTTPRANALRDAAILNPELIAYANDQHASLDAWTPPEGIEVDQIAGWGIDTVGGIDFYSLPPIGVLSALEPTRAYRPFLIEDGDGTVPVPSALMMASSPDVKRYWLNLDSYYKATKIKRSHSDLFEIPSLQSFIKDLVTKSASSLPIYISQDQPVSVSAGKKLTFFLHSSPTLKLTDASGNVTGMAPDGSVTQDIPGSTYSEFGEVKYITVPENSTYELTIHGQSDDTFSLDIQESAGGTITTSSTMTSIPATASTVAHLTIADGVRSASALTVDINGDGTDVITLVPKVGEIVTYEPPVSPPEEEPQPQSPPEQQSQQVIIGGGAGGDPVVTTTHQVAVPTTTSTIATTTGVIEPIATTTVDIATTTEVAILKKKVTPIVAMRQTRVQKVATLPPKREVVTVPQLASVYEASQQPLLKKWGIAVYNKVYELWSALKKLF